MLHLGPKPERKRRETMAEDLDYDLDILPYREFDEPNSDDELEIGEDMSEDWLEDW